jgi:hypothetical protein
VTLSTLPVAPDAATASGTAACAEPSSEQLDYQPWQLSWRADPRLRPLADRHYNRQSVGAKQFVPPGRCLVLRTADSNAGWVTSWPLAAFTHHAWRGALVNSFFRRESGSRASDLIVAATAATRAHWPSLPPLGIVTFVNPRMVRHKRDPGRCYRRAGWTPVGYTEGGLLVLQLLPDDFPAPCPAQGEQLGLFEVAI